MLERLICILIGYVFGLFQTSYIIGKIHKTDIREHGSGNAGTTNALRTFGKKAGAMTLLGDCLKCVFAIVAVRLIFKKKVRISCRCSLFMQLRDACLDIIFR